jgi:TolA-binding protein
VQDTGPDERLTVAGAAEALGISKEAVLKRISRGTLHADRDADGTVRVYIPATGTTTVHDQRRDLVGELRDRIRYLERQVEEERNARYRADELLARMMDRLAELQEAPTLGEPRESSVNATVEREGDRVPQGSGEGASSRPSERSWWRRLL